MMGNVLLVMGDFNAKVGRREPVCSVIHGWAGWLRRNE